MFNPLFCIGISFQEMALALESPGHENAVYTLLKSPEHKGIVQLAGTWQADYLYVRRVRKSHYTGQIRGSECAIVTGKSDYFRLPALRGFLRLFNRSRFF
jgi:hypothetical protein